MKMNRKLTSERLREVFHYEPSTGKFSRLANAKINSTSNGCIRIAGGQLAVSVDSIRYMAAHAAWLYVHGVWPNGAIRYKNGDPSDIKISNIEVAKPIEMSILTLSRLQEVLHYDSSTGVFHWRRRDGSIGKTAGSVSSRDYRVINVDNVSYYAHRLAWFYVHGAWPEYDIDHKDGDTHNNAITNLRLADRSRNNANAKRRSDNVSGVKGVGWCNRKKRWVARVRLNGKMWAKYCRTKDEAITARRNAADRIHGEYARHE